MQRVVIVGASGSGKTALGRWLCDVRALPFTDLDDLYWRPSWQRVAVDEFRRDVDCITRAPLWVLAGNYSDARDLVWARADTLVWLDLPLPLTLWRTTRRVISQARSGELICNGNRQSLGALLFGTDPLLWYAIRTVPQRRRQWPALLRSPAFSHLTVTRLRSRAQVAAWQRAAQDAATADTDQARYAGNTPVDK